MTRVRLEGAGILSAPGGVAAAGVAIVDSPATRRAVVHSSAAALGIQCITSSVQRCRGLGTERSAGFGVRELDGLRCVRRARRKRSDMGCAASDLAQDRLGHRENLGGYLRELPWV